jgi:hypothetical protein
LNQNLQATELRLIRHCFEPLGKLTHISGSKISFFECPAWRNPVMSTIFPAGRDLSNRDIAALTTHFANSKRRGTYDVASPYISLLEGAHNSSANQARLRKAGWVQSKKTRGWINLWTAAVPITIPKGFTFQAGDVFDLKLHRDFLRMQIRNFGSSKPFNDELDRLNRKFGARLICVVIYNRNSRPVASGLVINGASGSYLYSGSVDAKYRGRGLWRLLTAVRMSFASSHGGKPHAWLMLTRTPHLSKSGQISRRIETFVLPPRTIEGAS